MVEKRMLLANFGVLSVYVTLEAPDVPLETRTHIIERVMKEAEAVARQIVELADEQGAVLPDVSDDTPKSVQHFSISSGGVQVGCGITLQVTADVPLDDIGGLMETFDVILDQLRHEIAMHLSSEEFMQYYLMRKLLDEASVQGFSVEVCEAGSSVRLNPVL